MNKKLVSSIFTSIGIFSMAFLMGGCSTEEVEYLRIRNCEDYIYENDPDDPESLEDLVDQFSAYMHDTYGRNVKVVYSTYDTNEKLYNDLKIGKSDYDLIVPSDYMIQKLIANNLLEKFDYATPEMAMPNVSDYLSPYISNVFESIEASNGEKVSDYAVPYMWGTVGLVYSPEFYLNRGMEEDAIYDAFSSYDVLYDPAFKNTISIKDSVRDLYAIGVVHFPEHKEEIASLQEKLNNAEITSEEYQEKIVELFNRCDDATLEKVQEDLIEMKNNSFGFEVDQGKNDMINGTIGADIAWSGDAVFAIDEADKKGVSLKFSIPTENTASNIWFDGLCMPKSDSLNKELAQKFVDFLYDPEIACMNMDYIGYTCGAACDEILNLMYDYYDIRGVDEDGVRITDVDPDWIEGEDYVLYDLRYFFEGTIQNIDDALLYADPECADAGLRAQYPEASQLDYLAIMKDFGERNSAVMLMWERVKTSPIPVFVVVILAIELSILIGGVLFFVIRKSQNKKLRVRTSK